MTSSMCAIVPACASSSGGQFRRASSFGRSLSASYGGTPVPLCRWDCSWSARGAGVWCSLLDQAGKAVNRAAEAAALAGLAAATSSAVLLGTLTQPPPVHAAMELTGLCQLASLPPPPLMLKPRLGPASSMMSGMSAKNFDPERYEGRWFEVASFKGGFSGAGQEDCHCTQGIYAYDKAAGGITVDTFCVHGNPKGRMSGIRGSVSCVKDENLSMVETAFEKLENIREKCYLRFPSIPFIPRQFYDVIATDYDTYAIVSGAPDTSFVQIYSRDPNPGPEFIARHKEFLGKLGYSVSAIKDTPQDCPTTTMKQIEQMMSKPGMMEAMTNTMPALPATLPAGEP